MQRIVDPTASATLPAVPVLTGTTGYFTEGVPGTTPATDLRGWWVNMIQEELISLLTAGGITPDTTGAIYNQVLAAIRALITVGTNAEAALRIAADAAEASARLLLFSTVTYPSVTGSPTRLQAVTYTNSTGRPMLVSVTAVSTGAGSNLNLFVGGNLAFTIGQTNSGSLFSVNGIVPAGSTYRVTATTATATLQSWMEIY